MNIAKPCITCFAYGQGLFSLLMSVFLVHATSKPLEQRLRNAWNCEKTFPCDLDELALTPPLKKINKQWKVIALELLTSHMPLNAGPQQQRLESPTINPPGTATAF